MQILFPAPIPLCENADESVSVEKYHPAWLIKYELYIFRFNDLLYLLKVVLIQFSEAPPY